MAIRSALLIVTSDVDPVFDRTVDTVRSSFSQAVPGLFFTEERRIGSDRYLIEDMLRRWCDEEELDFVLTVGGTFPAPGHNDEQITPEATTAVLEKTMPSLPETMRAFAAEQEPEALLDRGVAGIRTRTLIVNLPGPERLAPLFAQAIVDLIVPIVVRLQPYTQQLTEGLPVPGKPVPDSSGRKKRAGLDAGEFAAFLAARQQESN